MTQPHRGSRELPQHPSSHFGEVNHRIVLTEDVSSIPCTHRKEVVTRCITYRSQKQGVP